MNAQKQSLVRVWVPGGGNTSQVYYNDCFDLKKVIARADRSVKGQLYLGGQYLLGFGKETLPYEKVITWVKPPVEEDEYIIVRDEDEKSFPIDDLEKLDVPDKIRQRGEAYFKHNHVKYLEVDGQRVRAIVEGTEFYEVEFTLEDGQISGLLCDCPYPEICKHDYAAILCLKELLKIRDQWYPDLLTARNCFTAVDRQWFEEVVLDEQRKGSVVFKLE